MGCASSRPAAHPADDDPNVSINKGSAAMTSPFAYGPEFQDVASRSTQRTGGTPWSSATPGDLAHLEHSGSRRLSVHDLQWRLCEEEIESRWTIQRLEEIKSLGCAELEVPKCRVSLVSCTHLWITTRAGAFSPALQVAGAPFQPNFDAFYIDKDYSPQIMEDARLDPRCARHPGVVGRPNLRFYFGAPMISRGNHLMGILYLWESHVRERPSAAKIARLEGLAADAVAALQRNMFRTLTGGEERTNYDDVELPTLWIDIFTPKWQVLGANTAWETLTGVSGAALAAVCDGMLDAMVPSNEDALVAAVAAAADAASSDPAAAEGLSIPAIISPCAHGGASLQYIIALRPSSGLPPGAETGSLPPGSVWVAEVHARVQAAPDEIATSHLRKVSRGAFSNSSAGSLTTPPNALSSPLAPAQLSSSPTHSSGGAFRATAAMMAATSAESRQISSTFLSAASSVPATALLGVGPMHIPPRLASLQLGALLGKGSFGSVYEGLLEGCPVAVKVMQQAAGPEAQDQFWAATYEAMVASDLEHPNLVRTIDWCGHADTAGGVMWIVQELCDAGSLSKAIKAGQLRGPDGKADLRAVLETALEVARGMAYLHSHDVLHGDLSSNNVLLVSTEPPQQSVDGTDTEDASVHNSRGFVAKVTDFGLSRALGGGADVATKTVGTVSHMPPELLIDGVLAKSGDVYSFGVMLWECLTGRRAWDGSSQAQVIFAITCKNARLEMPEDAPTGYAALTQACMDPDRAARPSFEEIIGRIEGLLEELGPRDGARRADVSTAAPVPAVE